MTKKILILSLIALMAVSCAKEKIVEKVVYKKHKNSWQRESSYSGSQGILLNSSVTGSRLNLLNIDDWISFDTSNNWHWMKLHDLNHSIHHRPPITDKYFALYSDKSQSVTLASSAAAHMMYWPHFHLPTYDSAFVDINDSWMKKNSECMIINDAMYCLVPYLTKNNQSRFFLIKPKPVWYADEFLLSDNPDDAIVKIVTPNVEDEPAVYFMDTYYNSFFVTMEGDFFKMDTIGNFEKVLDKTIYQMVQLSDSLIAFGFDKKTYLSVDKGETWQEFFDVPEDNSYNYLDFTMIDNKIVAYSSEYTNRLYHLYIQDNTFQLDSIPCDGLEETHITSFSEFNNQVYVTTLSGLFYKDLKDFFGDKR